MRYANGMTHLCEEYGWLRKKERVSPRRRVPICALGRNDIYSLVSMCNSQQATVTENFKNYFSTDKAF